MRVRSIHPRILVPLLGVMLVAALLLLYLSPFTHATSASPRITLANSVSAYTSKSRLLASAPANQPISLAIGLNLRNAANLDSYLQEITNPQSPLYRRYLNPASFTALYGPLPQSEASVSAFLRSQGSGSLLLTLITWWLMLWAPSHRRNRPFKCRSTIISHQGASCFMLMPMLLRCLRRSDRWSLR